MGHKKKYKTCLLCYGKGSKLINLDDTSLAEQLQFVLMVQVNRLSEKQRHVCPECSIIVEDFYEFKTTFIRNVTVGANTGHFDEKDAVFELPHVFSVFRFWNSFPTEERLKRLAQLKATIEESESEEEEQVETESVLEKVPDTKLELLVPHSSKRADDPEMCKEYDAQHSTLTLYECRFCTKSDYKLRRIKIHERSCLKRYRRQVRSRSRSQGQVYTCAECYTDESFDSQLELKHHVLVQHRGKFPCRVCPNKLFNTKNERSWHEAECVPIEITEGVRTRSHSRLSQLKDKASSSSNSDSSSIIPMPPFRNPEDALLPRRMLVKKIRPKRKSLTPEPNIRVTRGSKPKTKITTHQKFIKPVYGQGKSLVETVRVSFPKSRRSVPCAEAWSLDDRLSIMVTGLEEIREDIKSVKFTCLEEGCSYKTDSVNCLNAHDVKKHKQNPWFICLECQSSFTRKAYLEWHKRVRHRREPFFCHRCYTIFRNKHDLQRHIKAHGNLGFPCKICSMEFTTNKKLQLHWKNMKDQRHLSFYEKQGHKVIQQCVLVNYRQRGLTKHFSPYPDIQELSKWNEHLLAGASRSQSRQSYVVEDDSNFEICDVVSLSNDSRCSTPFYSDTDSELCGSKTSRSSISTRPTTPFSRNFTDDDDDFDSGSRTSRSPYSTRPTTPFSRNFTDNDEDSDNNGRQVASYSPISDPESEARFGNNDERQDDSVLTTETQFIGTVFRDNQSIDQAYISENP